MFRPYDEVKNWILESGLVEKTLENQGGVHSFYDEGLKSFGFLYPEITGYFISTLRYIHKNENSNSHLIDLAKASSDWLISIFENYGGIVMGIDNQKTKTSLAFSFDTAVCAKGLLDCYSLTNEKKYFEYAEKFVEWIKVSIETNGTVKPYKDLEKNIFMENDDVWYKQKGCLNIKSVIPFLTLFNYNNDQELLKISNNICNTFRKYQNNDGSFSMHEGSSVINLHTQCYALEGLLFSYYITKNNDYLESCKRSIHWSIQNMKKNGSIPLWFNTKYHSNASYPIAQLIRLMVLIDSIDHEEKYRSTVKTLTTFLSTLQAQSTNPKINGGFYEEFYKSIFGWKKRKKLNSWGSMFALQSFSLVDNYDKISFDMIEFLY
jgi:uncharacterized protein YyaL (SSP411 family)